MVFVHADYTIFIFLSLPIHILVMNSHGILPNLILFFLLQSNLQSTICEIESLALNKSISKQNVLSMLCSSFVVIMAGMQATMHGEGFLIFRAKKTPTPLLVFVKLIQIWVIAYILI